MNLYDLLNTISSHQLRCIAAHLHLRKHRDSREQWVTAIHHLWFTQSQRVYWLNSLSLSSCRALWRLLDCPRFPTQLFLTEFGPLIPAERRRITEPKERLHRNSSPAQELYNLGILFGIEGMAVDRTQWLTIADDLRQPLQDWLQLQLQRW